MRGCGGGGGLEMRKRRRGCQFGEEEKDTPGAHGGRMMGRTMVESDAEERRGEMD